MKIGIREKIIRRLGGIPLHRVGRDPFPNYFLVCESTMIHVDLYGIWMEAKYRLIDRKDAKREGLG